MLKGRYNRTPAPDSPQREWSESLGVQHLPYWGSRVHQISANTCLDPSVPSCSTWQGLEISDPLTLLTVNYGPEIIRGREYRRRVAGNWCQIHWRLGHPWTVFWHPVGTATLRPYEMKGGRKSGPCPNKKTSIFWGSGAPTPPTLCPPNWHSLGIAKHSECGYQPSEQR